jgi:hypothetical protein
MRTLTTLGLVALALAAGCGDGSTAPPKPPTPAGPRLPTLTIVSGDQQRGEVSTRLPAPLVVRLTDSLGTPVPEVVIHFRIDETTLIDSGVTDRNGLASVRWTLLSVAGAQRMVARATTASYEHASAAFAATALPGPPARISVVSGVEAIAAPNTVLDTVKILVTDRFENPVPAASVTWKVTAGEGSVRPIGVGTDSRGLARGLWRIGPTEGANELEVRVATMSARVSATGTAAFIAAALVVGGGHTCALTTAGTAYCWGLNVSGQLGVGGVDDQAHRVPRPVSETITFSALVAGAIHTCGLTNAGATHCWGGGFGGPFGFGADGASATTTLVASAPTFTTLVAGAHHTCGLTSTGTIYCWGDNALGQLGDGADRSSASWLSGTMRLTPQPVAGGHTFVALAAGHYTTCAISTDGATYCWGGASNGELAAEPTAKCRILASPFYYDVEYFDIPCSTAPTRAELPSPLSSLAIRGYGHCGLTAATELICWGYGVAAPRVIPGVRVSVAWVVSNNVCGLDASGAVTCWGVWSRPDFGIVHPFGDEVMLRDLDSSGGHSCGIALSGSRIVYCWGQNSHGQLGDGTTTYRDLPAPVIAPGR